MKVSRRDINSCRIELQVEVPTAEVSAAYAAAILQFMQRSKVAGFRPGKAPAQVVRQHYAQQIEQQVLQEILPRATESALQQEQLTPLTRPAVQDFKLSEGQDFSFTLAVDLAPKVHLKHYRGLKIERPVHGLEDNQVEQELENLRQRCATFEDKPSGAVQWGDYAVVNYRMFTHGKTLRTQKETLVRVHKEDVLPELSQALLNMQPQQTQTLEITLPQDFHLKAHAGKKVQIEVELLAIKTKKIPDLDDEFAKDMGQFETLQQLRQEIEKDLQNWSCKRTEEDTRKALVQELLNLNPFDVPQGLIAYQQEKLLQDTLQRLKAQGLTEGALKDQMPRLEESLWPQAEQSVRMRYLLDEIAKQESIEVDEQSLNAMAEEQATRSKQNVETLIEKWQDNGDWEALKQQQRDEQVFAWLIEHADISETTPQPEDGVPQEDAHQHSEHCQH